MSTSLILLFLVGCTTPSQPEPPMPAGGAKAKVPVKTLTADQAWSRAREFLLDGKACYRRTKAYCVTDETVVDHHIQQQLDRLFDGQMPTRDRDVGEVERKAMMTYRSWSASEEGAPLVAKAVQAYYDEPHETEHEGKGISIRMGVLPGTLVSVPGEMDDKRRLKLETTLGKDGELVGAELARLMQKAAADHPDQPGIRIAAQVPDETGLEFHMLDYRWVKESGAFTLRDGTVKDQVWKGTVTDWAAVAGGSRSLAKAALQHCTTKAGKETCTEPGAAPATE